MGIVMESSEVNLVGANCLSIEPELFGTMSAPSEYYETLHTIAINTRETEFGSYVEPIPITLKAYKHIPTLTPTNGYGFPQSVITPLHPVPRVEPERATTSVIIQSPVKEDKPKVARPPKKKWIKEYLEEEPELPVSVRVGESPVSRSNGVVRPPSPPPPAILDFAQEHSRPRTNGSHGPTQIPSPPSVGSNGSSNGSNSSSSNGSSSSSNGIPRAGTREVHNKLEKNRRAHLKECFEMLKRQLPATPDDKKTSNLSILGSAIRYIQVLRRKERECEHEMERLAREKIAAQQRLAALKREVTIRAAAVRPRVFDGAEDKEREENIVNGQVLGIPISINCSPPREAIRADTPPPRTLNLSTKLRTLPIQISPTTSQVVRASYGARHGALTLTTIAPAHSTCTVQKSEDGTAAEFGTLVQPAQIHLPISQVVGSGGLMVSPAAIQLLSTGGGLRVLQTNGVTTETSRLSKENGVSAAAAGPTGNSVVVSGLTPLVVSQSTAHLLHTHTHTITQKMVESGMVKNGVPPLAVSAQYLTATTIVKPVVVVTSAHSPTT
ncbi:max-binding protein MNT-like isoform X2 [Pieris napi]|uniref:max-binding protein MNT-like isoform X2 n=1 Tax=Pieris napi TaxID=78633 RepID=UPI001FB9C2FE|nr:max-binding protein MNT-like isoform X2 [Pieris napi]